MYLSRLFIKNYRSIREIDLEFKKGKNVIVGRNNAGKSNIIKALDLVLGENSPTYNKSQNITESDFFNNNIDEPLYIFCLRFPRFFNKKGLIFSGQSQRN